MGVEALRAKLAGVGQEHVLAFWATLGPAQQAALLGQVGAIDLDRVPGWVKDHVLAKPAGVGGGQIEPAACYGLGGGWDRHAYHDKGVELIRRGKVAAFTVAGGQGTRLGSDAPKGCYPAGAVTGKPLFACLADWIIAAQRRYCGPGVTIPWYVMTSPINHAPTVKFFEEHGFFGLSERDVMFFPQGVLPSFDMASGKLLLDTPYALAVSPDGHGGSLKALAQSGALADMHRRGIEQLSYTQIDNPLVRVIDPVFIGLHAFAPDSSGEMSSKMVPKANAEEKVGVLCKVDGRTQVIEYSDMPAELMHARDGAGGLRFNAGSIAIHVISTRFLDRLASGAGGGFGLPLHRAEKKVPFVDIASGQRIEPQKPNAVKLEMFVFDALPMCERSIVLETDRVEEFAPIKNASGADSPMTCTQIQTKRAARWLSAAGLGGAVPMNAQGEPDCTLELPPTTALEAADLIGRAVRPLSRGEKRAIGS
jgi:UDP-N-acetylglucosamine/UDP-N-acetylgalactosamine diphosphorylase